MRARVCPFARVSPWPNPDPRHPTAFPLVSVNTHKSDEQSGGYSFYNFLLPPLPQTRGLEWKPWKDLLISWSPLP